MEQKRHIWADAAQADRAFFLSDGRELEFSRVELEAARQHVLSVLKRDYMIPIIKEHDWNGEQLGEVVGARWDGDFLQLALSFYRAEDVEKFNAGTMRQYSPSFRRDYVDQDTGETVPLSIIEFSATAKGAQSHLRDPIDLNTNVELLPSVKREAIQLSARLKMQEKKEDLKDEKKADLKDEKKEDMGGDYKMAEPEEMQAVLLDLVGKVDRILAALEPKEDLKDEKEEDLKDEKKEDLKDEKKEELSAKIARLEADNRELVLSARHARAKALGLSAKVVASTASLSAQAFDELIQSLAAKAPSAVGSSLAKPTGGTSAQDILLSASKAGIEYGDPNNPNGLYNFVRGHYPDRLQEVLRAARENFNKRG